MTDLQVEAIKQVAKLAGDTVTAKARWMTPEALQRYADELRAAIDAAIETALDAAAGLEDG